ncbi:MAG: flavin reductase family protein [Bordetella sp.]|nr:flavin reductase family protein [Bordetella sp.]
MSFDCKDMSWSDQYKLMSSTVIPRPIALVSTEGPAGLNAAPFSFFNAIALGPPMLMFSIGPTQVEKRGKPKDTLVNIEATREFVIQLVDDRSLEKMNLCAPEYASDVNEMELAGFNMAPSIKVKPPRILDCPVQFECVLTEILVLGRTPYHVVIGEVVQAHYRSDIVDENLHIDMQALNPVGRLANPGMYARITDRFQLLPPQVGSNVLPSRTTPKQR